MKRLTLPIIAFMLTSLVTLASEELGVIAEPAPPASPVIEVYGNGIRITRGDAKANDYDLTDFEVVEVGEREDHSFSIHNAGDADLILDGPMYVNVIGNDIDEFSVIYFPSTTLAPGEWSAFTIRFEPDSSGDKITTVTIYSNDSNQSPFVFNIEGESGGGGSIGWFFVGGCGMQGNAGDASVLWIPLLCLIVWVSRRRFTSTARG